MSDEPNSWETDYLCFLEFKTVNQPSAERSAGRSDRLAAAVAVIGRPLERRRRYRSQAVRDHKGLLYQVKDPFVQRARLGGDIDTAGSRTTWGCSNLQ